jgi:hypothetical protein
VEAKAREVTIPKEATAEERAVMTAMYARTGAPGYKGQAIGKLHNAALAHTVFDGHPEVLVALKKAVDGLEHGHQTFSEVGANVIPNLDIAVKCVRRWVLRKAIVDDDLYNEWISGELDVPLVNERCALICKVEIQSPNVHIEYDSSVPPFRMWATPGPKFPGNLNIQALLPPSVATRDLGYGFDLVPTTMTATATARAQTLAALMGEDS